MHLCLQVQEIFSNVVAHIPEGDDLHLENWDLGLPEFGRRPTLAALARTCKAFHEIASARLWLPPRLRDRFQA